jgi:hypothetical protein
MRSRSRIATIVGVVGILALVMSLLWLPLFAPLLQRLPGGIDDSLHYTGTFTTNVDLSTGAQLSKPVTLPLTVDRSLKSISTGANNALLKETIVSHIGPKTETQTWTWLIDRSSMKNVVDSRTTVDKTGTYSINLPFDMSTTKSFSMWKPETASTYTLKPASSGAATTKLQGLTLQRMDASQPVTPVSADYQKSLAAQGFPMQLSPQQAAGRLTAAGIDLAKTQQALRANLSTEEMSQVLVALTSPLPLQYTWSSGGSALAEHRTGMIVSVQGVTESLGVRPDLSAAAPVVSILQAHAGVPEIKSLLGVFAAMQSAPPQAIYTMNYSQTPASVSERVKAAKDGIGNLNVLRAAVPAGIAGFGLLCLIGFVLLGRQPQPPAAQPERMRPEAEAPEVRKAA